MTRQSKPADPTSEHTAEQSTQTAGGLTAGRSTEPLRRDDEDVVARTPEGRPTTPRRYDEADDDPTLPSDDATLRTEI